MSSALAIAGVTAVLKDLLNNGLIDHNLSSTLGEVDVTALPPDRVRPLGKSGTEKNQLNIFLYHVSPNAAWRNADLPSRDASGKRMTNPPLGLDLHYLLIAHGSGDFNAEILLGYAMQLLHETPVLTRDAIRKTMSPASPVSGSGVLPPGFPALTAADLADQVEQIKICPQNVSTDEMSKLWTAFQANYRPTAAYQVSVVLIQSQRPAKPALPVLRRNLYALPFRQPVIASAEDAADPLKPVTGASTLAIRGAGLRGADTRVRIGNVEVTPDPASVRDDLITVALNLPALASLTPGAQGVQVIHALPMGAPPTPHKGFESNLSVFILHPAITVAKSNVTTSVAGGQTLVAADLTLGFSPAVGKSQRLLLLLNEAAAADPSAYAFGTPLRVPAGPGDVSDASLKIPVAGVKAGTYLVRVQVDGAESPLGADAAGVLNAPAIALP
jgi:hypothetical protein